MRVSIHSTELYRVVLCVGPHVRDKDMSERVLVSRSANLGSS